jgi:hypothetical protein
MSDPPEEEEEEEDGDWRDSALVLGQIGTLQVATAGSTGAGTVIGYVLSAQAEAAAQIAEVRPRINNPDAVPRLAGYCYRGRCTYAAMDDETWAASAHSSLRSAVENRTPIRLILVLNQTSPNMTYDMDGCICSMTARVDGTDHQLIDLSWDAQTMSMIDISGS